MQQILGKEVFAMEDDWELQYFMQELHVAAKLLRGDFRIWVVTSYGEDGEALMVSVEGLRVCAHGSPTAAVYAMPADADPQITAAALINQIEDPPGMIWMGDVVDNEVESGALLDLLMNGTEDFASNFQCDAKAILAP
jgi:hypothetical protein